MQLSKRLQAVEALTYGAKRLADVGTDHGYIPIDLLLKHKIEYAIAMDVNQGPLDRARANMNLYQVQDCMETRLSDGLMALEPYEADTVVIAGMGGPLTLRILTASKETTDSIDTFVLQPQSEIAEVRKRLIMEGFAILNEDMVEEDGKYYPMMRVQKGRTSENMVKNWEEYEYQYGKYLIESNNPVLSDFLEKEERTCKKIKQQLLQVSGEHIQKRLEEMEKELVLISQAKEKMR
ncbi:MAG: tRNA (adenine(22)-N(1))-methyltransferase [Muricoprocola sp.]